ncbi:MAG: CDP-alcohol phosphatidyltransferase family protein [Myxococcales bacterium]|nr:CDP-alcohol phosphatidyltransferase family protein [Myxococcales bacterium]
MDQERLKRIRNFQSQDAYPALVIRPLTILVMLVIADWKFLTPNRLTTIANLCKLAAAWLILQPDQVVLSIVMLNLGILFDHLDGTVARYRRTFTKLGSFYDKVSDIITWPIIVLAGAWQAMRETGEPFMIVLAAASLSALCIRGYMKWLYQAETERLRWFEAKSDPAGAIAKKTAPIVIAPPPERTAKDWLIWFAKRVAMIFAFEEMDLWFWMSLALASGHLAWVMWFLAFTQVPLAIAVAVTRHIWMMKVDRQLAAFEAERDRAA